MEQISIKDKLSWPYYYYLVNTAVLLVGVSWPAGALFLDFLANPAKYWQGAGFAIFLWLILAGIIFVAARRLFQIDRHPDLIALARYGPLDELVPQIEAELVDSYQAVQIGCMPKSFQMAVELWNQKRAELADAEVWITRSWLVYMVREAIRMQFFRLDSLVLVYPEGNKVILADTQGVRLEVSGTEAGRARLLAEVLTRVPWALNRFDAEIETTWNKDRQKIVAQVELRRQNIQHEKTG
jgi:hypothetical protein